MRAPVKRSVGTELVANRSNLVQDLTEESLKGELIIPKVEVAGSSPVSRSNPHLRRKSAACG
jgi:hypothetical protein